MPFVLGCAEECGIDVSKPPDSLRRLAELHRQAMLVGTCVVLARVVCNPGAARCSPRYNLDLVINCGKFSVHICMYVHPREPALCVHVCVRVRACVFVRTCVCVRAQEAGAAALADKLQDRLLVSGWGGSPLSTPRLCAPP